MIHGARSFLPGLGALALTLALAAPGHAQPSSTPPEPTGQPPSNQTPSNPTLGDTLRFLSNSRKPAPRRAVRTVASRSTPSFVLVPEFGPYGLFYVRVPVLLPLPPVLVYPRPVLAYPRPVLVYPRPVFVPAYPYGVPFS